MTSTFHGMPVVRSPHVPPGMAFIVNTDWMYMEEYRPNIPDPNRWRRFLHFITGRPAPTMLAPKPNLLLREASRILNEDYAPAMREMINREYLTLTTLEDGS